MSILPNEMTLTVLNIGTAVLVRDVMDQHLRSLGDIRTYYASNLNFALQTYSERHLDLIFCELTFPGGSAEEFIRQIGGIDVTDNLFFVMSTSQDIDEASALASELCIDSVLPTPFSTNDIVDRIQKTILKKERDRGLWIDHLLEAKLAAKNMRVQEAKLLFKELLKNHPQNEDIMFEAARFHLLIPDFDTASSLAALILAKNPKNLRAKSLLGTLCIRKGELDAGLSILQDVQKLSPLNTTRSTEIGSAYLLMALRQARRALDINEASVPAILSSMKYLTVLERYTDTVNTYERYRERLIGEEKRTAEYYLAISKKLGNIL